MDLEQLSLFYTQLELPFPKSKEQERVEEYTTEKTKENYQNRVDELFYRQQYLF